MILLLDADENFRAGLAECLIDDGHEVCAYPSAGDVPDLDSLGDLRGAVLDYQLGGENGLSFADRLNRARPHVPIVLATAVPQLHLESAVSKRSGFLALLRKPFQYETLLQLLHLGK
jgi:FixJ family two-component response regulator